MAVAVVSGSGGLIGSESVRRLVETGWEVIGLENDLRAEFFGPDASTASVSRELIERYPEFRWLEVDIRDAAAVDRAFSSDAGRIELVVHTAAQPSHDWAAPRAADGLRRQRERHAQPSGGGAPPRP